MLLKTSVLSMAVIVLMSCINQEDLPDPYVGCCGTEPVKFSFGDSFIYIPNLFTPNGDAINDRYKPFFDKNEVILENMVIKSIGENSTIIATVTEDEVNTNPYWGWFGRITQESILEGRFLYEMTFRLKETGETKTINGSACSVICHGTDKTPISNVKQCFFPAQYSNFTGVLDAEFPLDLEVSCLNP